MNNSVNSSPRSKATRMSHTQSEYQIVVAFVKRNLDLFLRLVSTDIHNKDVQLSATEFNTLRIIFDIQSTQTQKSMLSQFAPFFQQQQQMNTGPLQNSAKVHMNVIIEWINNMLSPIEPG